MNTISEEQVLHNELSFEINQELIHLMKRIIEIQKQNTELKDNWNKLKEWLEEYFKGMTIEQLGVDDYYRKGMFRMNEYTLDKMREIEGGMNE